MVQLKDFLLHIAEYPHASRGYMVQLKETKAHLQPLQVRVSRLHGAVESFGRCRFGTDHCILVSRLHGAVERRVRIFSKMQQKSLAAIWCS